MTDQELRQLVRDAIARAGLGEPGRSGASSRGAAEGALHGVGHSSHAMFALPPGDPDGRCVIEPGVPCNHCGYCKSYGH